MRLILILLLILSGNTFAQTFEIPAEKTPFIDVIDWRGKGAILISRDATNNRQLLTFVGNENRSIWQETIVPKTEKPWVIQADGVTYLYFLDQLEPENGKVTFYQLNTAGNVKTTSASFMVPFKKIGYDINELKLVDIQLTDRALVYLFHGKNKENKSDVLLMASVTHHNFLSYASVVGEWKSEEDRVEYAGFTDDKIAFYNQETRQGKLGNSAVYFNSKSEKISSEWMELPFLNGNIRAKYFGQNGKNYLSQKSTQKSYSFFRGGKWNLLTVDNGLLLLQYDNKKWLQKGKVATLEATKSGYDISLYPMEHGLWLQQNDQNVFVSWSANVNSKDFASSAIFNPSKAIYPLKTDKMIFDSGTHWLLFSRDQLEKTGAVNFELLTK